MIVIIKIKILKSTISTYTHFFTPIVTFFIVSPLPMASSSESQVLSREDKKL